jgi:putative Holliday junction resolvase
VKAAGHGWIGSASGKRRWHDMRILAIDTGERRVGFALSDPLGVTAQGLDTFDHRRDGNLMDYIEKLARRYSVKEIVVGDPVGLSEQRGESAARAAALAAALRERLRLPVTLWDERFSSEEAKRVLRGTRADKEAVDKVAAVIILQSYLDYRRRPD